MKEVLPRTTRNTDRVIAQDSTQKEMSISTTVSLYENHYCSVKEA